MKSRRQNPITLSKILCATFIILFYVLYAQIHPPARTQGKPLPKLSFIQHTKWNNTGKADVEKKALIKAAMRHAFDGYARNAWGKDNISPVSGAFNNSHNAWGAFIVDSSTSLVVMGMWEDLPKALDFISKINFHEPEGLVDPFEITTRYLGAMISIVELGDSGMIPKKIFKPHVRRQILEQARILASHLLIAFDAHTGLPWPKIDFRTFRVSPSNAAIGPARAGNNFIELCALTKMTSEPDYCNKATLAWAGLVRNKYVEDLPGLVEGPINVETGELVGRDKHWDVGHAGYYDYLLKASLLLPESPNARFYQRRWIQAADAVRHNLTSRSAPYKKDYTGHLYMGKWNGEWYLNEMSYLSCFAPGNLMLGSRVVRRRNDLMTLGQALLEGCRHVHKSSPTGLGPEQFSWELVGGRLNGTFEAKSPRQEQELNTYGFWVADSRYLLRPQYVESLFVAWRTTGEQRYRDWAWDIFLAIEKHCKTQYGYGGIDDVMTESKINVIDNTNAHAISQTLKYLYLIFDDVSSVSLDNFIFSTQGHLFRAR